MPTTLLRPTHSELPAYLDALTRGWAPDNVRPEEAAREQIEAIALDPDGFLAIHDDPEVAAGPIPLPDGGFIQRLPSLTRWIWDGGFCGLINLRWAKGTSELPDHVLGHVGYTIVPWRSREGHATRALALLLPQARAVGLDWIDLVPAPDNAPSIRVIEANGGKMLGRFRKPASYGDGEALRYRIQLAGA
jgi:predicted acetyltransferase